MLVVTSYSLVGTLEYRNSVRQMKGLKNAAVHQRSTFIQPEKRASGGTSSGLKLRQCGLRLDYYSYVIHPAPESRGYAA
jgi:hypothetical protein